MKIKLELEWSDFFIGIFHKMKFLYATGDKIFVGSERHIWICVVPCLPIHIWWKINRKVLEDN